LEYPLHWSSRSDMGLLLHFVILSEVEGSLISHILSDEQTTMLPLRPIRRVAEGVPKGHTIDPYDGIIRCSYAVGADFISAPT